MPIFSEWDASTIQREIEKWVNREGQEQFMCLRQQERIKEYLSGAPLHVGKILVSLDMLGAWYSSKAVTGLLEGSPAQECNAASLRCEALEILLDYVYHGVSRKSPGLSFYRLGLALCKALALGRFSLADQLAQRGRTLVKHQRSGTSTSRLTPFAISVYCKWKGIPPAPLPERLVVEYHRLLDLWDSPDLDEVSEAVLQACDFHTYRTRESTMREIFEFASHEYKIYPVEILAVLRLRQMRGLPLPDLDHPLMNTPLGHLQEIPAVAPDPLIDDLLKKLRIEFPSLPESID